ncbi:MAG: CvpA family protein [Candidatus Aminicenantes bacterium]|nr:CvpA family protein [Candidatus Aminicenantes bacterium]
MIGWLDIVLLLVILAAVVLGVVKGFVREAIAIGATVMGFVLAAAYYPVGAGLIGRWIGNAAAARIVSFLLILVLTVVLGTVLVSLLSRWIKGPLKFLDRVLGLCLGLIQGVLICGALVFALVVFPADKEAVANSRLAPYCFGLTKAMVHLIPSELRDQFRTAFRDLVAKSENLDG